MSYDNTASYWDQVHAANFDSYVAQRDQAEADRIATERMGFWFSTVFPAVTTTIGPSGGGGPINGVSYTGPKARGTSLRAPSMKNKVGTSASEGVNLGNVDDWINSQNIRINKKIGDKLREGRLPYPKSKDGFLQAKESIVTTLKNPTQSSSLIPKSAARGDYDLIHIYSQKTGHIVSLRVLGKGKYEFDTLIPEKSSRFK